MSQLVVILPAAGMSSRFGRNKLLEILAGKTVIARSLRAMANHPAVEELFVATDAPQIIDAVHKADVSKPIRICPGGATRAHSVLSALRQVPQKYEWVAIHDAARPLVSYKLIDETFNAAKKYGAAAPALPVTLTIKHIESNPPARVVQTVPRHSLAAMQTPQIARRAALLEAFERCPIPLDNVTDDLHVLELAGKECWLIAGEEQNIKITTQMDLRLAEVILSDAVNRDAR